MKTLSDKHIPERTCVACRMKGHKEAFFRVVLDKENDAIIFDSTGRENGRGAYICRSTDCVELAKKRRSLNRSFCRTVPEEIYQRLVEELDGSKTG